MPDNMVVYVLSLLLGAGLTVVVLSLVGRFLVRKSKGLFPEEIYFFVEFDTASGRQEVFRVVDWNSPIKSKERMSGGQLTNFVIKGSYYCDGDKKVYFWARRKESGKTV